MLPALIDQMHVIDAGRAGRHASEAGETAVDMLHHLGRGRAVVLEHLLYEVDAAARPIELVAEQHIGRTGRVAKAAMHASAQNLVGFREIRVGELGEREICAHRDQISA